jgi:hypothetical protein
MAKTQLTRTGKAQQLFKNGVRPIEVCKGLWTINEDRYELPLQAVSRKAEAIKVKKRLQRGLSREAH